MIDIVCRLFALAFVVIIVWIILSYVVSFGRLPWGHPVRKVYDALARAIDPLLRPIRRLLPPLRLGGMALDLSPIILILGLSIAQGVICGR